MPIGLCIAISIAAAAVGLALGYLFGSRKAPVADRRIEQELREQLGQRDTAITQLREQERTLLSERERVTGELDAERRLAHERRTSFEERLAQEQTRQEKALADLREAFKALSADALRQNAPEFLRLAEQTFGKLQQSASGELAKRQEAISGLLKPLEEHLRTYQERLQQGEQAQTKVLGEVTRHLETLTQRSETLASETQQFHQVLTSNQARGRWGEETLRRVVEAAGMSAHVDYLEQSMGDEGKPDMLVKLPGNRVVIVDSKVPDLEFLSGIASADTQKRSEYLRAHAQKLRGTITDLARRDYPSQFPGSLDYVVLFMPAESLFSAALEGDDKLILWAAEKRIMLATPSSLIALLRAVSISWLQNDQTENARAIAAAAQELYARVAKFLEHFERIRDGLDKAGKAYNEAVGSYERMVRPAGERLSRLGGGASGKEIGEIDEIDGILRTPSSIGGG